MSELRHSRLSFCNERVSATAFLYWTCVYKYLSVSDVVCIGRVYYCLSVLDVCAQQPFFIGFVCTNTFLCLICVCKFFSVSNMYVQQYIGHVCTTTFLYWTRLEQPFCIGPFCWTCVLLFLYWRCVYNDLSVLDVCVLFLYWRYVYNNLSVMDVCTTLSVLEVRVQNGRVYNNLSVSDVCLCLFLSSQTAVILF